MAVRRSGDEWLVASGEERATLRLIESGGGEIRAFCDGALLKARVARSGAELTLLLDGIAHTFVDLTYAPPVREDENADGGVRAPVSGVLVSVEVKVGDIVWRGQALATIEAMKMQHDILAPIDGIVESVRAAAGAQTPARALLFEIKAA